MKKERYFEVKRKDTNESIGKRFATDIVAQSYVDKYLLNPKNYYIEEKQAEPIYASLDQYVKYNPEEEIDRLQRKLNDLEVVVPFVLNFYASKDGKLAYKTQSMSFEDVKNLSLYPLANEYTQMVTGDKKYFTKLNCEEYLCFRDVYEKTMSKAEKINSKVSKLKKSIAETETEME